MNQNFAFVFELGSLDVHHLKHFSVFLKLHFYMAVQFSRHGAKGAQDSSGITPRCFSSIMPGGSHGRVALNLCIVRTSENR